MSPIRDGRQHDHDWTEQLDGAHEPPFERRRDEIAGIAARLFDREGYAQTSMNAVAREAGLRKPSLYHYFASKTEILVKIHTDHTIHLWRELERYPRDEFSPERRLRAVLDTIVLFMQVRRHYVRVFFEYSRELPEAERTVIDADRTKYREAVVEMFRDGTKQGLLRDVDPYYATMALFGISNWVYQWYERDPGSNPDHISDILWSFFWPGIRA